MTMQVVETSMGDHEGAVHQVGVRGMGQRIARTIRWQ